MSEILVVGDVHERADQLQHIITTFASVPQKVFLGDFWDSYEWHSDVQQWQRMIQLLGLLAQDPRNQLIWGNHDVQYALPQRRLFCSGYNLQRQQLLSEQMPRWIWKRFEFLHWADSAAGGWLFSHAGVHAHWAPVQGQLDQNWVQQQNHQLSTHYWAAMCDARLLPGRTRGGSQEVGGYTWLDLSEFQPIDGVSQAFGHTECSGAVQFLPNNWCVDCGLREVLLINTDTDTVQVVQL